MLDPLQSLNPEPNTTTQASPPFDPSTVLEHMAKPDSVDGYHASILLARLTQEYLPEPVLVQRPLTLVSWRIETPQRIIVHTGRGQPNVDDLPHLRPKILLDERARRLDPSAIHVVTTEAAPEQHVRASLLHYAQTELTPFYETVGAKQQVKNLVLSNTLEEAMSCFMRPPVKNHSTVELNQSKPWDQDHVDSRYGETQTATNGTRYRDYLCVYANDRSVEKAKLESHVLEIPRYYQTLLPFKRGLDQPLEWVLARSSLPLDSRVLHDIGSDATQDRFTTFIRAVKGRFLQDLKLLPVADPDTHTIQRANTSVYIDEPSLQALVVYSPDGQDRLQFVSLSLLPARA